MEKLINFNSYAVKATLKRLLQDKSTKKNIIWATNTYEFLGPEFDDKRQIEEYIFKKGFVLEPRTSKSEEIQIERTRKKAEVFTPSWVVNQMNNFCDEDWFGKKDVFNIEKEKSWHTVEDNIIFPEGKTWKDYINSSRLEITCGEAPYLVSRYDVSTGEKLDATITRMGMLDRKLRIVNENTDNKEDWIKWAVKSIQNCYGYEYQGDNLLIARINILLSYVEYYEERWNEEVEESVLFKLANIIAWNIWQMDGLTNTVPYGAPCEEVYQVNLFDLLTPLDEEEMSDIVLCRIFDRKRNKSIKFIELKEK